MTHGGGDMSYVNNNEAIEITDYPTPPRYAGQTRSPPRTPPRRSYSIRDERLFTDVVPPGKTRLNAVKYFAKLLSK